MPRMELLPPVFKNDLLHARAGEALTGNTSPVLRAVGVPENGRMLLLSGSGRRRWNIVIMKERRSLFENVVFIADLPV